MQWETTVDDAVYPVREFWNQQVVSKEVWKESWLADYVLESIAKSIEKRDDFVMITKEPKLVKQTLLPSPLNMSVDNILWHQDFPVLEEDAEYVVLDYITYAAVKGEQ
jgi:hypothetical protein